MLKYVQSKDGVFVRHIFDVEPTRWDDDNFCFARKLTPEQAAHFGVTKLKIVTPPYFDPATQRRDEGPAVLTDGVWVQQYVVTALDVEEAQTKADEQAVQVRAERDRLLVASDWWVTKASETGAVLSSNRQAYRQALRDITAQAGFPWAVQWPTQPEM